MWQIYQLFLDLYQFLWALGESKYKPPDAPCNMQQWYLSTSKAEPLLWQRLAKRTWMNLNDVESMGVSENRACSIIMPCSCRKWCSKWWAPLFFLQHLLATAISKHLPVPKSIAQMTFPAEKLWKQDLKCQHENPKSTKQNHISKING